MKKYLVLVLLLIVVSISIGCSGDDGKEKITVAATPVPHAEILKEAKSLMKEKGYNLVIKEFSDYVTPNLAVDQNEVEANFFQHVPYLDDFNKERGTHIVSIGAVHYEPFGIYKGQKKSLEELSQGDKIAVPNDITNEARALLLLESAGIIKLKNGASLTATIRDIVDNPYDIQIVEMESAQIPRALDSVAVACMNGNYAIEAGFKVSEALYIEDQNSEAAVKYANVVCVKEGREEEEWAKALIEALKSDKIKNFIEKKYEKSVIAVD